MNTSIVPEVTFFFITIAYGGIGALCYDQLRVIRKIVKHSASMTDAQDILFFSIAGLGFFEVLFLLNQGRIRWFAIAGCILGVVIYRRSISRFLCPLEIRFLKLLLFPVRFFLGAVRKVLQNLKKQITIKVIDARNNRINKKDRKECNKKETGGKRNGSGQNTKKGKPTTKKRA